MRVSLAGVMGAGRRRRGEPAFALVEEYLRRASAYVPCEFQSFETESALLRGVERRSGRVATALVLFDGRGAAMSSEEFAAMLRGLRDGGRQEVVVAVGPASGWGAAARARADATVSLGRMTLPHGLAQAVVAEQIYRAMTILAGHPYHCGH